MTAKEWADVVLRLLQVLLSWPVILLMAMIVTRRQLPSLISRLADRMTKAPGGFEFAKLQDTVKDLTTKVKQLERVVFQPSAALTPDLQQEIQSALGGFQTHLATLGYKPDVEHVSVYVDPKLTDNVYYDNGRIVLGEPLARDTDAIFREYTHHALIPGAKWESLPENRWAIESGLADYFPCSFNDDPLFAEKSIHLFQDDPSFKGKQALRNLKNQRHFREAAANSEHHNVGEIWGGAFWELRERLGQERADRLLFATWFPFDRSPRTKGSADAAFVAQIIETAETLGMDSAAADAIRTTFSRRGIKR